MTFAIRRAARLILLDGAGRCLLFQYDDPFTAYATGPQPHLPIYWCTPGGGIEPGETVEAAARRELFEETGLEAVLGSVVARRHVMLYVAHGSVPGVPAPWRRTLFDEHYLVARAATTAVTLAHQEPVERALYRAHRWWSAAALRATADLVLPPGLAALLDTLAAAEPPALVWLEGPLA